MKRFRVILLTIAVVAGVGTAFASSTSYDCIYSQQYRLFLGTYVPVYEFGGDYACWFSQPGICTYWKPTPWANYQPCQLGHFIPIY